MEMSERKMKILKAIIDDYINTGIPVGSRTLSKKPGFDYSPATIRNEMADLEDMGFLEKPHTSAGRAPSDLAYRFYVDRMMRLSSMTEVEAARIRSYFTGRVRALEQVIDMTATVLSEATQHVSMVTAPQMTTTKLLRIQMVRLSDVRVMVVFVTDSGMVKNTVINVDETVSDDNLQMLSNMLSERTHGCTLAEASEALKNVAEISAENRRLADEIFQAVNTHADVPRVVLGGVTHILDYPEYGDMDRARDLLKVLETKDKLASMLSTATDMEFTIRIGKENPFDEFKGVSVVTATYSVGGEKVGSYGIIGPTRMNYAKVLSVLHYVGRNLNEILSCFLEQED